MKLYYLTRINVIVLIISIIFFICNSFMDVPFTRTFHGDVIHYEIVKVDTIRMSGGVKLRYNTDITCVSPTGRIETFEYYDLEPNTDGKWQYLQVVDNHKFYTNNGLMYALWSIILAISLIIFFITCAEDAWDNVDYLFDNSDVAGKRKCRNMRAQHMITLENFLGLSKEDQEVIKEAYQMFKEHTLNMQYVKVPTYSETIDELNKYVDKIEIRKRQNETGIANGTKS